MDIESHVDIAPLLDWSYTVQEEIILDDLAVLNPGVVNGSHSFTTDGLANLPEGIDLTGGHIDIPVNPILELDGDRSWEFLFKRDSIATKDGLLSVGHYTEAGRKKFLSVLVLGDNYNSNLMVEIEGNAGSTRANARSGVSLDDLTKIYHAIVTWDHSLGRADIFIDGADETEILQTTNVISEVNAANNLHIGAVNDNHEFDGTIYMARQYDAVLTQAEIGFLFNSGAARVYSSSEEEPPAPVLGCTDSTASNYDSTATEDDGSCTYPPPSPNGLGVVITETENGFIIEGGTINRQRLVIENGLMTVEPVPVVTGIGPGYDIFLVAGQSNTYHGEPEAGDTNPHPVMDAPDSDIFQWGRHGGNDGQVIQATVPLDHIGYLGNEPPSDRVGWAMAFAKMYKAQGYLEDGRQILLIPAGEGGTSFFQNNWNKGDSNYNDAINRTLAALQEGTGTNVVKGILWHQGEGDTANGRYQDHETKFLATVDNMRLDLGDSTIPFVAGGLMPSWITGDTGRLAVDQNMRNLVTNRTYSGFADPSSPTVLTTSSIASNQNHYSSFSMRGQSQDFSDYTTLGLAGRYWIAYLAALVNI